MQWHKLSSLAARANELFCEVALNVSSVHLNLGAVLQEAPILHISPRILLFPHAHDLQMSDFLFNSLDVDAKQIIIFLLPNTHYISHPHTPNTFRHHIPAPASALA